MTARDEAEWAREELERCNSARKSAPPEVVATVLFDAIWGGGYREEDSVDDYAESQRRAQEQQDART